MNAATAVWDDPEEWKSFSYPAGAQSPGEWQSHVSVQGMHCAACAGVIEGALLSVPGVTSAQVNAATGQASVHWSEASAKPSQWLAAVEQAGYQVVPVDDVQSLHDQRVAHRLALWRWLVAGFCMMQVMMYAIPAYVAGPGELTDDMSALLRWASWVLSLPVIIFSCGPYFQSAWRDIRMRRVSMDLPVALGILITFGISTIGTFEPASVWGEAVYFDSLTMFVFFLLTGRWLEQGLRTRTAGALQALSRRLPVQVERLDADGNWVNVVSRRLVVGDLMRVLPGQAFAADGRIEAGQTQVDEALVTGESRPLARQAGDAVLTGSYNLAGTVTVRVERVGSDTRYAQIVALMEAAAFQKPRMAQIADRWAGPFLLLVLLAAGLGAAYQWWVVAPGDLPRAVMVAVAVLVVTCPCALSIATPSAMLAAAGTLARNGVLVRNLQALEVLESLQAMVFDKTGTLTSGDMRLTGVTTRPGANATLVRAQAAALAAQSLHPVSRALVAACHDAPVAGQVTGLTETPGAGLEGRLTTPQGASTLLRLGSAAWVGGLGSPDSAPDAAAGTAARRMVHLADESGWLASFEFDEAVRADARATVQALAAQGVVVKLFSGDQPDAVQAVARELGIGDARGPCSPDDKLRLLRELQTQGLAVGMVGDGLNDGPVLAAASVSFAMGRGVPLAQAQADFVVQGDRLHAVVDTLNLARRCMRIVRQNLWWAVLYNVVAIPLAISGVLTAWLAGLGMALSSLLVVANAARLVRQSHPNI